jgi:hypothetical protein
VRTEFIQNFPFDYGAQFIHGEVGNPLYDYAARNGLLLNIPSFEGEGKSELKTRSARGYLLMLVLILQVIFILNVVFASIPKQLKKSRN